MTNGIHHITAISSDPQDTYDFYNGILSLRMVKKTVNQDDIKTYHLYFGDEVGSPGMNMTFFPYTLSPDGEHTAGMVNKIMFSVPIGSLDFWKERLGKFSVHIDESAENSLGDKYLEFKDWDGQILQIVETKRINPNVRIWENSEVEKEFSIKNFYGAEIDWNNPDASLDILKKVLEFHMVKEEGDLMTFENKNSGYANLLFIRKNSNGRSFPTVGNVHHIAFRVKNDAEQIQVREKVISTGINATEVIDRFYFKSVYFREPGGVLFEIATDGPGFDTDESVESLGEHLALPPFLEDERDYIENTVSEIKRTENLVYKSELKSFFKYYEDFRGKDKTIFLLHGMGANQYDLLGLLNDEVLENYNIISLKGNVNANGITRFFERYGLGKYNEESIKVESKKLNDFIEIYRKFRNIKQENILFIGLSNGANMILASQVIYPKNFFRTVLLHPAKVIEKEFISNKDTKTLVTYGQYDQMISINESLEVVDFLKKSGVSVEEFDNGAGHGITEEELEKIWEWVGEN